MKKFFRNWKKWYENGVCWFVIGVVGIVGIIFILWFIKRKWVTLDTLKYIGSYIAGVGVFFSYFYNKREERKIKVHSEANWRGRLFNLAQKKNVTYQDILYFLTFFNNNAEPEDECDYRLLQAIGSIINSNGETGESQGSIINSVYSILYSEKCDPNSSLEIAKSILDKYSDEKGSVARGISSGAQMTVDAINELKTKKTKFDKNIKEVESNKPNKNQKADVRKLTNIWDNIYASLSEKKGDDCCDILKALSVSSTALSGEQRAAFQLCIEFLLKDDWNKQMNKK